MHLSERSIVAILSNNVLSTKEQGLSAPTMSAQKLNAHSPALLVKRELYISNPKRLSRTALSILEHQKDNTMSDNDSISYYKTIA